MRGGREVRCKRIRHIARRGKRGSSMGGRGKARLWQLETSNGGLWHQGRVSIKMGGLSRGESKKDARMGQKHLKIENFWSEMAILS